MLEGATSIITYDRGW